VHNSTTVYTTYRQHAISYICLEHLTFAVIKELSYAAKWKVLDPKVL